MIKKIFGVLLVLLSFIVPFLAMNPNLYSQNSAGKIYKEVEVQFDFLKEEKKEIVLLYFGYVGCRTICFPALTEILQIYENINKNRVSFYFINLQDGVKPRVSDLFAKAFSEDFTGVYLSKKQKSEIVSKLNVKYLPSAFNKYELDHSGFLYVLKKQNKKYVQKFIYTARPYDIEFISNDLKKL